MTDNMHFLLGDLQPGRDGFFQTLIDTIPLPIFYKDAKGAYSGCNRVFEEVTGLTHAQIVGRQSFEVYPGGVSDRVHYEVDQELLSTGGRKDYQADFEFADGSIHRMVVHKAVYYDQENRIAGLVGAILDITEQKRFEQALIASERSYRNLSKKLETILEVIPNSLTLWDEQRKVTWANHHALSFFLSDPAKLVGKGCKEICHLEHEFEQCVIRACFDDGQKKHLISRSYDGKTWSIEAFPVVGESGRIDNVLTLATDITESIRLREEAQRSAHLAALGELSAGIAHEINNPTGLILMNMSLVRDVMTDLVLRYADGSLQIPPGVKPGGLSPERLQSELPEVIEEIIDSAERIKHIVEDLKDFARVQDASCFVEIDLNEVVAKSLRLLNNTIRKATDNFVVDYTPELPPVRGISQRIEQVVINIVLNACQSLGARTDNITVAVYHDAGKGVNCIRVWDEGSGIDPTILAQVTDPFFTTKREQGGTGLGLSVSSRIMAEHNGHLHIDSKPGRGTMVTLELPVAEGGGR